MPRNSSGTYTLPIGAFSPGGLIKSSDHNSNYSDIATALTQSVATTGVSSMTGPLKAAAGSASGPSITFASDTDTGFYLAGTDQMGLATNGTQLATFNSDQSVTWAGAASWAGNVTYNGAATVNGALTLNGTTYTFGSGAANAFIAALSTNIDVQVFFDGGGSVLTNKGIFVHIPCNMTIFAWGLLADQSGSVSVDIARANNGIPSASIVGGGTKPNLSSSQFSSDNAPASWTSTSLNKDDWLTFTVQGGASSVTQLNVTLRCTRTAA